MKMRTRERLSSITIQDGGVTSSLCKCKANLTFITSNSLKNLRLVVYTLSLHLEQSDYSLERSDYLVERSDQRMERSGLERSGHGTKWP